MNWWGSEIKKVWRRLLSPMPRAALCCWRMERGKMEWKLEDGKWRMGPAAPQDMLPPHQYPVLGHHAPQIATCPCLANQKKKPLWES